MPSPHHSSSQSTRFLLRRMLQRIREKRPAFSSRKRVTIARKRINENTDYVQEALETYSLLDAEIVLKLATSNQSPFALNNRVLSTIVKVHHQFRPEMKSAGDRVLAILMATPASPNQKIAWMNDLRVSFPELFSTPKSHSAISQSSMKKQALRSLFEANLFQVKQSRVKKNRRPRKKKTLTKKSAPVKPSLPVKAPTPNSLQKELSDLLARVPSSNRSQAKRLAQFAEEYEKVYAEAVKSKNVLAQKNALQMKDRAIAALRALQT